MEVSSSRKNNKRAAILFGVAVAFLLAVQGIYFGIAKLYPDLISDQQSIANSLAFQITDAQTKYHHKNGFFSRDLTALENISVHGGKYYLGYANEFPVEIGRLCSDCIYQEQAYKLLIVIKWLNGATVWSLSNKGELKQLSSVSILPKDFKEQ
jgi:hypothetical protein